MAIREIASAFARTRPLPETSPELPVPRYNSAANSVVVDRLGFSPVDPRQRVDANSMHTGFFGVSPPIRRKQMSSSRRLTLLRVQDSLFPMQSPTVAAGSSVISENAMAGDDEGDRVLSASRPDGARSP